MRSRRGQAFDLLEVFEEDGTRSTARSRTTGNLLSGREGDRTEVLVGAGELVDERGAWPSWPCR